jgi:hypothetical protein
MKKTLLTGIAALFLATGTAQAISPGEHMTMFPPAQYDKPYDGELEIRRFSTEEELRQACHDSSIIVCTARTSDGHCHMFIMTDDLLKVKGFNYALALRHELAHCNGWPKDHPGGKWVRVDTRVEMPKLPASTKELPAYPPIVCVTPDWKSESCKSRNTAHARTMLLPVLNQSRQTSKIVEARPNQLRHLGLAVLSFSVDKPASEVWK